MTYCRRAAHYSIEYQESRDFDFFSSLIGHHKKSVLEIPCGAGRLSTHLASLTDDLTIVDKSGAMIEQAKQALADAGYGTGVIANQGDLRTLELNRQFDLIIVPREALQLLNFESAKIAVQNLIQHLTPKVGQLIIDLSMFNRSGDPDYFYDSDGEEWQANWVRKIDEKRDLSRRSKEQNTALGIKFIFEYEIVDENPSEQWFESVFLRKFDVSKILNMVCQKPICIEFWGGYSREGYTPTSDRLIASITMR